MKPLRRFLSRLKTLVTRQRDEARMEAEIAEHIALQIEDNLRAGLQLVEARRQAVLKFGAVTAVKESYRDQRGLPMMETLITDTRQAVRRLWKTPTFTLATVLTLALGIGATTSIFTLVHAVLLKSLAVSKPGELYRLGKQTHCCIWGGFSQDTEFSIVSFELYQHFRDNTKGFAELAAFQGGQSTLAVRRAESKEAAQSYPGEYVSGNYFKMFGVNAYVGRTLGLRDDQPQAPAVAVMSHRLWQLRYRSNPKIVGSAFNLNGVAFTIVGIAPPGFYGDTMRGTPPDFFLPLSVEPRVQGDSTLLHDPRAHWLDLIGRLKPGTTSMLVQAQMRVELKRWLLSHWTGMDANARTNLPKQTLYLSPGGGGITQMREQYERWLQILMLVSAFVLAIVCANVANLMLVRAIERRQQTSLNIALGARPSRIVAQALTESVLLSLLGGAAGVALAFVGTRLILHFAFTTPGGLLGSVPIDPSPSLPVLAFAFAASLLTGLVFGMGPAWMAARVDPIEALRGANRATQRSGSLSRKLLVVFQAALSLVLLSVSGLLTSALNHLQNQNFGFEQERRTIVNVDPQLAGYHLDQLPTLYRRLHDSFADIPGVASVSLASYSPMSGDSWNDSVVVYGHNAPGPKDDAMSSFVRVTGGFFDAIGNKVISGRAISDGDTNSAPHVAVVNEAFVKKFFKGEDPMGRQFGREVGASRQYEIVGVVKDARYLTYALDRPAGPVFFLPAMQIDVYPTKASTEGDIRSHFLHDIVVVTKPGTTLTETQIRRTVAAVDANMPVNFLRTLREQVEEQFTQQRLIARLTSFFGILSLVLASIGLYGVTAYNAGRRVNEIGVRMALGADRAHVISLVLRGAFQLIVFGLLAGFLLSLSAGSLLGNLLYGISPYNPAVLFTAVLALGLSALLASLIPAFRASRISPLQALRAE